MATVAARILFGFLPYKCSTQVVQKSRPHTQMLSERQLATLAKRFRTKAGISKAEAARQLGVIRASVQQAEEYPQLSLTKLRVRMIEKYSSFKIVGPFFLLRKK
jgi:DNA-binding XRE family transcriptional regulator